mgnify:FL=1
MFETYRQWYEASLGMSISTWVWEDFRRDPLPYVIVVPLLFWWLGGTSARWPRFAWAWNGATLVIAMLIAHIVRQT